jgi:NADPH-dependent 2,4-dienoyl-CoA reductase/sulfur reductase-like enzyme/rhodanese-related sulfurtransferase
MSTATGIRSTAAGIMSAAPTARRIVIVGGVAGGASAATRARRINESAVITVFEKDGHPSFANCGLPYYIGNEIENRDKLLVATADFLARRFRIDVRTRHEVLAINRAARTVTVLNHTTGQRFDHPYDKLILATGASPLLPPMGGVRAANVLTLRNLEDTDRIKAISDRAKHAVVIGAGYIGVEMVEQLVRRGIKVTLVELQRQVLPLLDPEMAHPVQAEIIANGVELCLGDSVETIEGTEAAASAVVLKSGRRIHTDLVIIGVGVRPNTALAEAAGLQLGATGGVVIDDHARTSDPDIYAVGDAAEYLYGPTNTRMRIALAGPANRSGRIAGEHAASGRSTLRLPAVFGTSIVRAFGVTAAMTGLTVKSATRFKLPHRAVIIEANHHAGYFPGARPLILKLLYSPDTRRVLGATCVGGDGVDKRIDIIATAMAFGSTVDQLAGLDLAYAPPFGSAKDPIHMAAFAAVNDLDGLTAFIPPDSDLANRQVLDVRTPAETATGRLPGTLAIPLDDLRARLAELDPNLPTTVICGTGLRAHAASRILRQHGFADVTALAGGMRLRMHALPLQPLTQD